MSSLRLGILVGCLCCFACQDKSGHDTAASPQTPAISCDSMLLSALLSLQEQIGAKTIEVDTAKAQLQALWPNGQYCGEPALDTVYADVNDWIGRKLYAANVWAASRIYFTNALNARKRSFPNNKHKDICRMYHNLGLSYFREKDYHKAIAYFDSSGIVPNAELPVLYFLNNLKTGQCYSKLGEYNQAQYFFSKAEEYTTNYPLSKGYRFDLIRSQVICYRLIKSFGQGISHANRLLKKLGGVAQSKREADLFEVQANVWQDSLLYAFTEQEKENALREALKCFAASEAFYKQVDQGRDENRGRLAGNKGELYRRVGYYPAAEKTLTEALTSVHWKPEFQRLKVQLLINRGETLYNQQLLERALSDFDSALYYLMPNYEMGTGILPPLSSEILDAKYLMQLLGDISLTHLSIYDQTQSVENLQIASTTYDSLYQLVSRIRGEFISDEAKLNLASAIQDDLQKAFLTAIRLYERTDEREVKYLEQAFTIAEQSKAFTMLEAVRLRNISQNLPESIVQKERKLLAEKAEIEEARIQARLGQPTESLAERSEQNFDAIRNFQQMLKDDYPKYYQIKYSGADLKVEDLQRNYLGHDQALIQYFQQDSALYIFLISSDEFMMREVPVGKIQLRQMVRDFRAALHVSEWKDAANDRKLISLGATLYGILLAPFQSALPERLILIPSAALHDLPFEALAVAQSTSSLEKQVAEGNFVLHHHAISYCFSANMLREMQRPEGRGSQQDVAIFKPDFNPELSRQTGSQHLSDGLSEMIRHLTPLQQNQENEVAALETLFDRKKIFAEQEASKDAFFRACQQYATVHVATHGILNQNDPSLSFIAFHQKSADLDINELLFVGELYTHNKEWNVDLMFLSACQTATGHYVAGEGTISMTRGLAYAGIRSLITTLWNVPTSSKAKIAPKFYHYYLNEGEAKDIALAKAKRQIAYEFPHPADWAGYILTGATD